MRERIKSNRFVAVEDGFATEKRVSRKKSNKTYLEKHEKCVFLGFVILLKETMKLDTYKAIVHYAQQVDRSNIKCSFRSNIYG